MKSLIETIVVLVCTAAVVVLATPKEQPAAPAAVAPLTVGQPPDTAFVPEPTPEPEPIAFVEAVTPAPEPVFTQPKPAPKPIPKPAAKPKAVPVFQQSYGSCGPGGCGVRGGLFGRRR